MKSAGELIDGFGVNIDEHLNRDELIPVRTGLQVQGDVAFIPTRRSTKKGEVVPAAGVPVVRGETGGNTHLLLAEGAVSWAPVEGGATATRPDLGVIDVPDDATAYMAHPEHGYLAFGPGAYIARRQVEHADQIRLVQD